MAYPVEQPWTGFGTPLRTFVFGDVHGDFDTFLRSLGERGLLVYEDDLDGIVPLIHASLEAVFSEKLEALIIPQEPPVRVVLMGDLVDRYPQGYHVIQFVTKVRWEKFGIELVPLLGNHDLLNLLFFSNPYEVHRLLEGTGRDRQDVMQYIGGMGIEESLRSFFELHHQEIFRLQARFYRWGRIEYPMGDYGIVLRYPEDLSWLGHRRWVGERFRKSDAEDRDPPALVVEDVTRWLDELALALNLAPPSHHQRGPVGAEGLLDHSKRLLGSAVAGQGERNWWRVHWEEGSEVFNYSPEVDGFNLFIRPAGGGKLQLLPIDWRLISLVWRRHYAPYFRRTKLLFLNQDTLFAHAGLSPLSMLDPMLFGNLFNPSEGTFRSISEMDQVSLRSFVDRTNRLYGQLVENAINDCSFRSMPGLELVDQMGNWRGAAEGLPEFGGAVWADFNCLWHRTRNPESDRIMTMYRRFVKATGVRRVICGHTYFISLEQPTIRYRKIDALEAVGLEYLCVDNGCSRAYRRDNPVVTGIEIAPDGTIADEGEYLQS